MPLSLLWPQALLRTILRVGFLNTTWGCGFGESLRARSRGAVGLPGHIVAKWRPLPSSHAPQNMGVQIEMIWKESRCVRLTRFAPLCEQPSLHLPSDRFTCSVRFSKRLVNVDEHVCALSVLDGYKYTQSRTVGSHLLRVTCPTTSLFSLLHI
jgi:hypothetical protein